MKIVIIAAMEKELKLLFSLGGRIVHISHDDFEAYECELNSHKLIFAQCGIGKVNSALRTAQLISIYKPDLIINSGVAGGVDDSMKIGSVLVADRVTYHDVWCGPGTQYGEADNCPLYFKPYERGLEILRKIKGELESKVHFGLICSGDKFITTPEEVHEIKYHFPEALGCDMESASIAQTCFKFEVPFMIIRVMSDMPGGGENISEYQNFWNDAPIRTFEIVAWLIREL